MLRVVPRQVPSSTSEARASRGQETGNHSPARLRHTRRLHPQPIAVHAAVQPSNHAHRQTVRRLLRHSSCRLSLLLKKKFTISPSLMLFWIRWLGEEGGDGRKAAQQQLGGALVHAACTPHTSEGDSNGCNSQLRLFLGTCASGGYAGDGRIER